MDWPESPDAPALGDGRCAVAVDRPDSVESLREIVARRAAEGLAIYPQGGKTALDYGGVPRRPGVALDTTALDAIIDYPAADMTVTIGAGITLAKLQSVLATEGQFLPLDAPMPAQATLGGIYATSACGPRRFGWGRPRDHIIGVSFVTADGKEVKGGGRVVKNVAGYDFPKLMTGSMGTLGLITQITLKVRPKPQASSLVVIPFHDITTIQDAVVKLNTSVTRPTAIEVFNGSGGKSLSTPVDLRKSAWSLVLGFEDNASSVAWQIDQIWLELGRSRSEGRVFLDAESVALWNSLAEFPAIDQGRLSLVASVPRSSSLRLAASLDSSEWMIGVHAGSGIVTAHLSPQVDDSDLLHRVTQARATARSLGGSVVLSRCPTEWKDRLKVWGAPRGDWQIMERIKAAFDPRGVMNPGRFVGTI